MTSQSKKLTPQEVEQLRNYLTDNYRDRHGTPFTHLQKNGKRNHS